MKPKRREMREKLILSREKTLLIGKSEIFDLKNSQTWNWKMNPEETKEKSHWGWKNKHVRGVSGCAK